MTISTTIAGVKVKSFVGTASGCYDTTDSEVKELAASTNFLTIKSTTEYPRVGNAEPRIAWLMDWVSQQSMGLPNRGLTDTLATVKDIARRGLTIKASIAGLSLEENITLMRAFQRSEVSLIELNMSCPNTGEKVLAYDFDALDHHLGNLTHLGNIPIGLKLPFYNSIESQNRIVDLSVKHGLGFLTCINGMPGLAIDIEKEQTMIAPNGGVGAIGGSYIQPFALLECHRYAGLLKDTGIALIGVGGVDSGAAAFRFALAGCDAVEVGSYLQANGPSVIPKINNALAGILQRKGYQSPAEVKGKLKFL